MRKNIKLNKELELMAAFTYGWLQGLLYSFRNDSWSKLIKRPEIKDLLINKDENVIDIEVQEDGFGSVATSIRVIEDNNWCLDEYFDIYDIEDNLVAENITIPFRINGLEQRRLK